MTQGEGNKLIAEFMGVMGEKGIGYTDVTGLKYHSDWNWLTPVVEKIEKDTGYLFGYFDSAYFIKDEQYPPVIVSKTTMIETIWLAVVDFIMWYKTKPMLAHYDENLDITIVQ